MIDICVVLSLVLGILCFYFIILNIMLQSSYSLCESEKHKLQGRLTKCSSDTKELRAQLQDLLTARRN